jgi:hypothetical protein
MSTDLAEPEVSRQEMKGAKTMSRKSVNTETSAVVAAEAPNDYWKQPGVFTLVNELPVLDPVFFPQAAWPEPLDPLDLDRWPSRRVPTIGELVSFIPYYDNRVRVKETKITSAGPLETREAWHHGPIVCKPLATIVETITERTPAPPARLATVVAVLDFSSVTLRFIDGAGELLTCMGSTEPRGGSWSYRA